MFQNKLTCPHCKEEVATVGFRYSPKQWLFVLPILVIGLYPLFSLTFFKSYAQDDLQISSFETKIEGDHLDVIGVISNVSENAWTSVSVEGEFYDADGNFIEIKQTPDDQQLSTTSKNDVGVVYTIVKQKKE